MQVKQVFLRLAKSYQEKLLKARVLFSFVCFGGRVGGLPPSFCCCRVFCFFLKEHIY